MKKENWKVAKAGSADSDVNVFKTDFKVIEEGYYPTRLEFMFAHALQGLIIGRSEKDIRKAVNEALKLAQEALRALDDTAKD